ncbi:MAG: molybdate ABC transporter substrate-binding protein [Thermoleophilia bacterium]|nr:molybdate ABC transporter substrate-binding protein [Thermoleophilia bacterium]
MRRPAALAVAVALLAGGCATESGGGHRVTVFAAASLADVLETVEPGARFNFAGSDELATQLREGARADVYAAADAGLALALHREGLLERPRRLCSNRVVVVVPRGNPARVRALADLARPGVKIVIGDRGVPAGDYARAALARAPGGDAVLANVVSEEQDVKGVVGKVALGEADAGFAYRTDVGAAGSAVAEAAGVGVLARAEYAIAVVRDGERARASAFLRRVFAPHGRRAFRRAGFVTSPGDGRPLS